jgi:hypothetical protein
MSHPFDEFSKSLSEASLPRRESLRRLAAVFAGAVLSPLGLESASADPQPRRYRASPAKGRRTPDPCEAFCKCRNAKQQSNCLAACRSCGGNTSRIGGSCGSYVCCSTASCNGVCSDLNSNANCGACGNNCGASGQTCCNKRCADLKTDAANCGACGRVCGGSTPYCVNGTCSACPAGQTKCGASCVDLLSDNGNCGLCGNVCASGSNCMKGTCTSTIVCPPGFVWCGLYCANLDWDASNCGSCGYVCPSGFGCGFGTCGSPGGGDS